ncbi:host cell division inhibitory peptide Kil, partial [Cronobacter sakazakii]
MPHVNHNALRAAQSKAVIARFLGDSGMWLQA